MVANSYPVKAATVTSAVVKEVPAIVKLCSEEDEPVQISPKVAGFGVTEIVCAFTTEFIPTTEKTINKRICRFLLKKDLFILSKNASITECLMLSFLGEATSVE